MPNEIETLPFYKRWAVTGATGTLGRALVARLAENWDVERIAALSRDEVKMHDLVTANPNARALRAFLGDVRDQDRLEQAFAGVDVVVHAAALKRVEQSTYSPEELIKTNVAGTINVIKAASRAGVKRVVVVSSDKAVQATNLYGMTKAVAEAYAVNSNSYTYPRGTAVSCVRYGNVLGSRGSVVHIWRDQLRRGEQITLTSLAMTRFIVTIDRAVDFVMMAARRMRGGETFIPRLSAAYVTALADAVAGRPLGKDDAREIGLRPGGEKLHESLLSEEEIGRALFDEPGDRYVIPPFDPSWTRERFDLPLAFGFQDAYTSATAPKLSVDDLARLVEKIA